MRFLQLHRTYAACLLAALALGASCTKTVYDEGQQTQSPAISLSVTEVAQTRAMIDNTNFGKDGNRIQVYDFWTDGSTESKYTESKYIDAYAGREVDNPSSQHIKGTTWPFVDKSSGELVRYNWTSTGVHKFFGWFAVDATTEDGSKNMTAESFFGNGFSFNETSKVLTIPAKTLDQSTPQFDFLYSDIKTVDVTKGVPSNVPMSFSHLFAAVSFGAKNTSNSVVKLLEFKVEKLYNAKSATINFSGSTPTVVYADGTQGGVFRSVAYSDSAAVTVPKDGSGTTMYNIFGKPGKKQEFTLIWPQAMNQLHSDATVSEDNDGNPIYPDSYKMYVKYTVDGVPFTKRINFDNTLAWEAGKKYHYDIIFADKMVELKCVVNPWDYVSEDINFENQTVSVKEGSTLSWDASVSEVDVNSKKVAIKDNKPAVGTFTLDTPKGGRWFAYLSGDVDAFKIIDGEGPVGTPAKIQVQPVVDSPLRDYVVNVHFIVRTADGKTLDADSVLQPDVYSIILPKNK